MPHVKQIRKFMARQVNKVAPAKKIVVETPSEEKEVKKTTKSNNKKNKKDEDMLTKDDFNKVENVVNQFDPSTVKVVKKDRGLIERTESSKIVLTEDNRQVLND